MKRQQWPRHWLLEHPPLVLEKHADTDLDIDAERIAQHLEEHDDCPRMAAFVRKLEEWRSTAAPRERELRRELDRLKRTYEPPPPPPPPTVGGRRSPPDADG